VELEDAIAKTTMARATPTGGADLGALATLLRHGAEHRQPPNYLILFYWRRTSPQPLTASITGESGLDSAGAIWIALRLL
jgi:hypothetical protein